MSLGAFDRLVRERASRWTEELREYCAIPSETAHPEPLREAARWTADRLRAAGARVETIAPEGVPPLIVGEFGSGERALICVQHYDVQPAEPLELWKTPPFEPTVVDGRLYARGASDNKGHALHRIQAIEAYQEAIGPLPLGVRFLVEGEEESGSRHLEEMLGARPALTQATAALAEGGGIDERGRPAVACGFRGLLYVELGVRTLTYDAHSGGASLLPNAAWRLVQALAVLSDGDGTCLVDGFYNDVRKPSEADIAHMRSLPFEEDEMRRIYGVRRFVAGRSGNEAQIAGIYEPTCNIDGIWSGFTGQDVKTITPAEAHAKLDLRLVPNQDPQKVLGLVRGHLAARGFGDLTVTPFESEHPYWTPVDHPLVLLAARVSEEVWGKPALRLPSLGGTAPMHQVCAPQGLPQCGIGSFHPEARLHAPNENAILEYESQAIRTFGRFLSELATAEL